MKNMLVVIDNIGNVKELIKKSLRLLPEKLTILVFESSVIKKVNTALETHNKANCETVVIDVSEIDANNKTAKVIELSNKNNSDTIILNRPDITDKERDLSFEKNLLKGKQKTNLLICGNKRWKPAMNVLGTLDISNNNKEQSQLNAIVFDSAIKVTKNVQGNIHFMTVIAVSRLSEELDIVQSAEVLQEKGDSTKAKLDSFVQSKNTEIQYIPYVTAGIPQNEIPSIAHKKKMDLVVLGNVGRTGLKGLIVGNTAEKILQRLSVDVLIVKNN